MQINLKQISGNWDQGFSLDKHTLGSTFLGYSETGRPIFDTTRSEAGEALYQLKYNSDWSQAADLAQAIVAHITPKFENIGFVVPVPASTRRQRQPVNEIAKEVASKLGLACFENIIVKAPGPADTPALKDVSSKEDKVAILDGRFTISDQIKEEGKWSALVIDDLFDTGASMEAVCGALRGYPKVDKIFVATLTWK